MLPRSHQKYPDTRTKSTYLGNHFISAGQKDKEDCEMFAIPVSTDGYYSTTSVVVRAMGSHPALFAREETTKTSDGSESSSKSTTSKSSTSSKCKGDSKCQKPTDSTSSTAVAIAVVVPVVVVFIVLGIILWRVWRRNKKESLEDDDPDFDGDGEYLPEYAMFNNQFEMKDASANPNGTITSSSGNGYEDEAKPPTNPFANQNRVLSNSPSLHGLSATPVDPFQLPASNDTMTLRNFAKNVQASDFDGYRLASHSASQLSISRPDSVLQQPYFSEQRTISMASSQPFSGDSFHTEQRISDDNRHSDDEPQLRYENHTDSNSEGADGDAGKEDSFEFETSPVKSTRGEVTQGYVEPHSGIDVEKSFDDRNSLGVTNEGSRLDQQTISTPKDRVNFDSGDGNDEYLLNLSPKEEEDIKRIKSIYQVYLDRNGTVKTVNNIGDQEHALVNQEGFAPTESLPSHAAEQIGYAKQEVEEQVHPQQFQEEQYDQVQAEFTPTPQDKESELVQGSVAGSVYTDAVDDTEEDIRPVHIQVPASNLEQHGKHRAASSIYSEIPQYPQEMMYQQQQQYPPQQLRQQQYPLPPPPPQQQQQQQFYYQQQYAPQQFYHPQSLENIEELPTPTSLQFSASSHSLTSFKKPSKQPRSPTTAMGNSNTPFNPIDHPHMFYNQNTFTDDQQSTVSQQTVTGQVLPHHLRQSIVMTNPSELSQPTLYKPAGSFRNISAANSRNNSMNSGYNTYQQHLVQQRVSGILDEHDTLQPPSVGGILPHSGSQEDLRKQLGSSHNYSVK